MQPEHTDSTPRSLRKLAIQFLIGAILGFVLVLIPLSYLWYFTPAALQASHLIGSGLFVFFCGFFSAFLGNQFIALLTKILEAFPSV